MVEKDDINITKKKIKETVKKEPELKNITNPESKDLSGTYLFFSFDLVNSTMYKPIYKNWPEIIGWFYKTSFDEIKKELSNIKEWKKIGDETLFYLPVRDELNELRNSPFIAYKVMNNLTSLLHRKYRETKGVLFVKSTVWSAYVKDRLDDSSNYGSNILIKTWDIDRMLLEFLGPDIDVGFRISKYSSQGKVVVDANLACLLSILEKDLEKENISQNLKIVSYEELKGVWYERKYPIVWYHEHWADKDKMFLYDEEKGSEIIRKLKNIDLEQLDGIDRLTKILIDVGKIDDVQQLRNGIMEYSSNNPAYLLEAYPPVPRERLAEIHFVVILMNKENGLLVLKRNKNKKFNPGKWEFGCSQLHLNEKIIDSINKEYKKDLGLSENIVSSEDDLQFVNFYSFKKDGRIIPGIIFKTECKVEINKDKIDKEKYEDLKWIKKEDDLQEIEKKDAVDNFHENIKLAFGWRKY